jgi:hypothetical protein
MEEGFRVCTKINLEMGNWHEQKMPDKTYIGSDATEEGGRINHGGGMRAGGVRYGVMREIISGLSSGGEFDERKVEIRRACIWRG